MTGKLPIDPMGEARWSRIERSLFKKIREGAATPAVDAASARATAARPSRTRVFGAVTLTAAVLGSGVAAAAVVMAVRAPAVPPPASSRIVTEGSASHVVYGEASLDVAPSSVVEVEDEPRRTVVRLERGEVALRVAPRPAERPLVVEAGDVRVRVMGTEFSVRREADGASVHVVHGVVEVRAHGERAEVGAGETWPAAASDDAAREPSSPALRVREPVAPGAAQGPTAAAASSRAAEPRVAHEGAPRAASGAGAGAAAPGSAQAQFEAAASLEKRDPATALARYAALARGSDAWAANALYAAGRLRADRREPDDARRLLAEYLRRFPDGPNAEDARALLEALR